MKGSRFLLALVGATATLATAQPARAQDMYLGQIFLTGASYCPQETLEANGQLLQVQMNQALFSLFGTTFGGDGRTTFALPDLRGRAPIGNGQGPGLQNYPVGQASGSETVTITQGQMPPHAHSGRTRGTTLQGTIDVPTGGVFADFPNGSAIYNNKVAPSVDMAPNTVITDPAGGGQPVSVRNPYLALRYCVVIMGPYPSRPD